MTIYKHTPEELARIRALLAAARTGAANPTEPNTAELAAVRKAGAAAVAVRTAAAVAAGRSSIEMVRAAPASHLDSHTRRNLLATADDVAHELDAVERLSAGTTGARNAAVNLERAAGRLEAVVTSPWGGLTLIVEARELRAAAHAQRCAAESAAKAQAKRRRDKPATADDHDDDRNARVRQHHARLVEQGHPSPTEATRVEFSLKSRRTVQRIVKGPAR